MHQNDLKEKDEFILFFKIILGKIASAARNWIQFFPPNRSDDLCLFFCFNPSSSMIFIQQHCIALSCFAAFAVEFFNFFCSIWSEYMEPTNSYIRYYMSHICHAEKFAKEGGNGGERGKCAPGVVMIEHVRNLLQAFIWSVEGMAAYKFTWSVKETGARDQSRGASCEQSKG